MGANLPGFANEDEEATYCLSLLRDGDRAQKIVARERLSQIFEARGLLDAAAECLETNVREGVRDPRVYQRLAGVYRRQGRHELADEVLVEARRLAERQRQTATQGQPAPPAAEATSGKTAAVHPLEDATAPLPAVHGPSSTPGSNELALDRGATPIAPPRPPRPASMAPVRPWWASPPVIVIAILLCGPFGLLLLWLKGGYAMRTRAVATVAWLALAALIVAAAMLTIRSTIDSWLATAAGQTGVRTVPPTPLVFPTPPFVASSPQPGLLPSPGASPPALAPSPGASPRPSPVLIQPGAQASPTAAPGGTSGAAAPSGARVRVANTGGSGANLREGPSATAAAVKTEPEGAVLTVIGPDQQADGRTWRNVRDEAGASGWIAGELLEPAP
ncbi:MAG: hypothetical protein IT305_23550 [Chloroflexi bacterium]|nr:hypothetical protein [Chloroflexota bacterium]